jgi:hypothetical protein
MTLVIESHGGHSLFAHTPYPFPSKKLPNTNIKKWGLSCLLIRRRGLSLLDVPGALPPVVIGFKVQTRESLLRRPCGRSRLGTTLALVSSTGGGCIAGHPNGLRCCEGHRSEGIPLRTMAKEAPLTQFHSSTMPWQSPFNARGRNPATSGLRSSIHERWLVGEAGLEPATSCL